MRSQASDNCFNVRQIRIEGSGKKIANQGRKITRKYQGKCLNSGSIKSLVRDLTNYYVKLGYTTTRVYIPKQNLSSGLLRLYVMEGRIEEVLMWPGSGKKPPFLPLKNGRVLLLRDIEQTYDHYGRLRSNNVHIDIKPGSKNGTSKIVIDNRPEKRWRVKSSIDNSGSKQKGRVMSTNSVTLENIFGFNENYSISHKNSLDDPNERSSNTRNASFGMPFGYNELALNCAVHKDHDKLYTNNVMYLNRGYSKIFNAGINRVLHRNGVSKTTGNINFGKEIYENYLNEHKTQISSYKITKSSIGLSHQNSFGNNLILLGFNYINGINKSFYNKFEDLAVPSKQFEKIAFNASLIHFLPIYINSRALQLRMNLSGQYSPDMLVASEKISLGGVNSVRGFRDYSESGENAILMRNELVSFPAFIPIKDSDIGFNLFGDFSFFTAFDMGAFRVRQERGSRQGFMSGIATGIRNSEGVFDIECVVAYPLKAPGKFKKQSVFYFNFGVNI